jgi:hypothetical protein
MLSKNENPTSIDGDILEEKEIRDHLAESKENPSHSSIVGNL